MLVPPIAHQQDGVFSRRQARAAGLSRWHIAQRLAERFWIPVIADVYMLNGLTLTADIQARAAHLATGGVVSHESAAVIHRLGLAPPDQPHVTTSRRVHLNVPGVVEHRLRLLPHDCTEVRGVPLTTRRRTVVDLLASSSRNDATTLLFRAVQHSWLNDRQLQDEIAARRNMTGTPQLRALADLLGTGAHSAAEHAMHQVLASIDGLRWRANAAVALCDGSTAVVDVLVDDARLAIEVDGRSFHGPDRFQADRSRQNALVATGYAVLRFTWLDVVQRPEHVRQMVQAETERLRRDRLRSRS